MLTVITEWVALDGQDTQAAVSPESPQAASHVTAQAGRLRKLSCRGVKRAELQLRQLDSRRPPQKYLTVIATASYLQSGWKVESLAPLQLPVNSLGPPGSCSLAPAVALLQCDKAQELCIMWPYKKSLRRCGWRKPWSTGFCLLDFLLKSAVGRMPQRASLNSKEAPLSDFRHLWGLKHTLRGLQVIHKNFSFHVSTSIIL